MEQRKPVSRAEMEQKLLECFPNSFINHLGEFIAHKKIGQNNAGKALPSAGDVNLAYEIINYRYVSKLPTIISSEFLLQELVDIDEALAGRIAQMAGPNAFSINLDRKKNWRLKGMVEL